MSSDCSSARPRLDQFGASGGDPEKSRRVRAVAAGKPGSGQGCGAAAYPGFDRRRASDGDASAERNGCALAAGQAGGGEG